MLKLRENDRCDEGDKYSAFCGFGGFAAREPGWWEPVNAEEGTPEPFGESMEQVAEPEIPPLSKNGVNHVRWTLVNQGGTAGNYLSSLQQAAAEREDF